MARRGNAVGRALGLEDITARLAARRRRRRTPRMRYVYPAAHPGRPTAPGAGWSYPGQAGGPAHPAVVGWGPAPAYPMPPGPMPTPGTGGHPVPPPVPGWVPSPHLGDGQIARGRPGPLGPPAPAEPAGPSAWEVLAAAPREPGWVRWRRAAVAVVAAVLVLTGAASIVGQVLRWVAPPAAPSPAVAVTDAAFAAVAVPFAVDYLSWDAAARLSRQTALARAAAPDTTVDGWGGSGRQWADSPTAVGIARADAEHAVVTVRARVTPYTAPTTPPATTTSAPPAASASSTAAPLTTTSPGLALDGGPNVASGPPPGVAGWTAGAPRWVNLAVPVARRDGRIVVTAPPVLVGSPQLGAARPAVPGGSTAEDAAFAGQTREVITTLLRAYGSGELDYARASGTAFTGLDKAAAVQEVTAWRVRNGPDTGDGSVRVGDVTVTWVLSGGAGTLRCTYRVELRGDGGRWYLASIGAATEAVT